MSQFSRVDKINITINNTKKEIRVNSSGYFEYSFKVNQTGIINITVNYDGNQNYIGSSNQTSIKVKQINTKITSDIQLDTANDQVFIIGILTDENNNTIKNEQITLNINDETYTLTTNNIGLFNHTSTTNTIGLNYVNMIYDGNYYYNSTGINKTFTVPKKNITATININDPNYAENMTINGKLTDENNKEVKNETIIISINNNQYNTTTNDKGEYIITKTATRVGINNITLIYNGNTNYNEYEISTTVNVEKQDIIITYNPIQDTKYKENLTITGKITDINEKALYNINALININNKLYKAKTDSTGTFTLTTTANTVGLNNVTLSYAGNINYNSYQTNTTFNVDKQDITITYNTIKNVKYKDSITIAGKITDINGRALYNINAFIYIDGKLSKAKTDSNGAFTLSTTANTVGLNNVTIEYNGNTNYNSYQITTSFQVEKQDIIITCNPIQDTKYKENLTITGKITDINEKALYNINALININNKLYKAKTDSTGTFTLTTTANTVGLNNVTLSYAGNINYNSYQTNTTFNVDKQDITITYNTIKNVKYKDSITIAGKITDINGRALYNINAFIYIDGKLSKAKTDGNGAFTLSTTANTVGLNNVTIEYNGNTNYNSYQTNTTFQVEKQDITITSNPITNIISGENVTINGTVNDNNGYAINNINVNIRINNKLFKVKTDKIGAFTLTTIATTLGTNNVTLSYAGNTNYNNVETVTTFNVITKKT